MYIVHLYGTIKKKDSRQIKCRMLYSDETIAGVFFDLLVVVGLGLITEINEWLID